MPKIIHFISDYGAGKGRFFYEGERLCREITERLAVEQQCRVKMLKLGPDTSRLGAEMTQVFQTLYADFDYLFLYQEKGEYQKLEAFPGADVEMLHGSRQLMECFGSVRWYSRNLAPHILLSEEALSHREKRSYGLERVYQLPIGNAQGKREFPAVLQRICSFLQKTPWSGGVCYG